MAAKSLASNATNTSFIFGITTLFMYSRRWPRDEASQSMLGAAGAAASAAGAGGCGASALGWPPPQPTAVETAKTKAIERLESFTANLPGECGTQACRTVLGPQARRTRVRDGWADTPDLVPPG